LLGKDLKLESGNEKQERTRSVINPTSLKQLDKIDDDEAIENEEIDRMLLD